MGAYMDYKIENANLGHLGVDFQYRLCKCFIEEEKFFRQLENVIDQNMFTEPMLKVFVGIMVDYNRKYETIPSYQTIKIAFREYRQNRIDVEEFEATCDKIRDMSTEGYDMTKDIGMRFFRQQACTKIAREIDAASVSGDTDKIEKLLNKMNDAINIGCDDYEPIDIFHDEEKVLSEDYRVTIPVGIELVDEFLEGGLAKGELGLIVGSSSFGKTSLTTAMAMYASCYKCEQNGYNGYKVLQILFEDREKTVQRKHYARLSGYEAKDLSKIENIETVKGIIKNHPEREIIKKNLRIVRFPSGKITPTFIRGWLKKLINKGFRPDMVSFDYFGCLRLEGSGSENKYERQEKTMREIESMCNEFNIAGWVAHQGNRDSFKSDVVGMEEGGGSISISQIAHIIMTISKNEDDKRNNTATIAIPKNRAGKAGVVIKKVYFNNGTCQMNSDDAYIDNGIEDGVFATQTGGNSGGDAPSGAFSIDSHNNDYTIGSIKPNAEKWGGNFEKIPKTDIF